MTRRVEIMDPIHGMIRASEAELRVIDSALFQRLRRIYQLSGAHFVYPSARHSRFEHSLGVMHIAGMAAASLREKGHVGADDTADLRLAGLLHDIGHGPFSHLFEGVMAEHDGLGGASHEEVGRMMLERTELADALGGSARRVADLAFGSAGLAGEVVSGAIGADTMDYLLRDGYFTGSEHARVDHRRLTESMTAAGGRVALMRSALPSFESMMYSRRQMFNTVYLHKTVRAAKVMVHEALHLSADELGLRSMTLDEYARMTDHSVLHVILRMDDDTPAHSRARELARNYHDRRLPKCVAERKLAPGEKVDAAGVRAETAERAGVREQDVFTDVARSSALPLMPDRTEMTHVTLVRTEAGREATEAVALSELPLAGALGGPVGILRVYAYGNTQKVAAAAASVASR